jgi:iron(III) transport system ATP-binding protein
MLFDEPLSNLDALLRAQVRHDLHQLHRTLGFSGIYVTHDQTEAFALGDRLGIMRAGRIEQIGSPQDIYASPATEYAANFVGMSNTVLFSAASGGWQLAGDGEKTFDLPIRSTASEVTLRCRPHDFELLRGEGRFDGLVLDGVVSDAVYEGRHYELSVATGSFRVNATATPAEAADLKAGAHVRVGLSWQKGLWYENGARVPNEARAVVAAMQRQ